MGFASLAEDLRPDRNKFTSCFIYDIHQGEGRSEPCQSVHGSFYFINRVEVLGDVIGAIMP